MDNPQLGTIKRRNGVAGEIAYTVEVTYPGEDSNTVTFYGSAFGGGVVMAIGDIQTSVTDPSRFGEFGPEWVRRFFGS